MQETFEQVSERRGSSESSQRRRDAPSPAHFVRSVKQSGLIRLRCGGALTYDPQSIKAA